MADEGLRGGRQLAILDRRRAAGALRPATKSQRLPESGRDCTMTARMVRRVFCLAFALLAVFLIVGASVVGVGALVNSVFTPLIEFALRILTFS
jgi:hypothetical protein